MKILVPVKRVVDYNVKVRAKSDESGPDLSNAKMAINPFCEIAIEEAVRIKEAGNAEEVWSLFDSVPEKHLLPSVKHWDYVLMVENADFAFDLETVLKRNERITTAQYFEAHTQLTQRETHLLYEIRNL